MATAAQKRARRRRVFEGFPITPRALTLAEIRKYFEGDKVVCLLCGQQRRSLSKHLPLHGVTRDEYRAMYGLPYRRGLTSQASHDSYSNATEGRFPPCSPEIRAKAHEAARSQRYQPFRYEIAASNLGEHLGQTPSNSRDERGRLLPQK